MTYTSEELSAHNLDDDFHEDEDTGPSYFTTVDGGDWGVLLAVFQEVVDLGPIPDSGKSFLAPPPSCSFTYH